MAQRIFTLIVLFCAAVFTTDAAAQSPFGQNTQPQFLPVDQAFAFDFQQHGTQLTLQWQIHPGYYLYQQQIKLVAKNATLGKVDLPAGISHRDEFFGEVAIYRQPLSLNIPLTAAQQGALVRVTYQGCADAGFCYPPETREVPLSAVNASNTNPLPSAETKPEAPSSTIEKPELPFSPLWALLIGIGVAFTPCVLPMYPLISSLLLGNQQRLSARRIFLLAMTYVQGMALTYTMLGLVVAAAGLRFQAALQNPYMLIGLSLLFIALALSMFGVYSLQLPSSLQTKLVEWSNRQRQGSLAGIFSMGALAGLICSPCTTAPLSALLLYIAQSGNLLAGGGSLYLYALGMGLPLIVVTLFGNRLLPKNGPWMVTVKEAFGFIILALPVFLLERVLGDDWGLRLWSLLGVTFFGWAFILSLRNHTGWMRGVQILLLLAALVTVRPLQDWLFVPAQTADNTSTKSLFTPVRNRTELQTALVHSGRATMLDLYANWCIACKEFEKYTFSDSAVRQHLKTMQRLQIDVTANSKEQNALLKQYQVLGLPTILFFDASGKEISGSRVTGFMNAKQFQLHLRKLGQ
ncbi:protein-disulfide reductase DsbD [Brenneria uluponensis]|uniref:protein-disulfide reductase DsbD n=1 Tax=Brenneria uluponensis TaxID=3057057 RepID=UPI0028ECD768|nr:protein-disulfide reductase DsbD [Brenneria ulupoensis]